MILVLELFISNSVLGEPATHDISVVGNEIIVQTRTVSLTLSITKKGAIVGLYNPDTGQFFKLDQSVPNFLWLIDGHDTYISSNDASEFSYSIKKDSSSLELNWRYPSLQAKALVKAERAGWITLSLNITNRSPQLSIRRVFFPYIGGIRSIGEEVDDDLLAVPEREGYVIENVTDSIVQHPWGAEYPGTLSMQFVYFYEKYKGGIYIGVHDNRSNHKGIELFRDSSQAYRFNWYHYAVNIVGGNSFTMNYSVVIRGVVGYDWQAGAQVYREWALRQWYVGKGKLSERTDIPAWVKNLDLVWTGNSYVTDQNTGEIVLQGEKVSEIPSYTKELRDMFPNASLMLFWMGWNRDGFDRGYPEYYPPRDGDEALKRAIQEAHLSNVKIMLYFNGRLVDVNTQTFGKASQYLTVDEKGRFYIEKYGNYLTAAVPDPSTEWWKSAVINFSVIAVRDYKADAIFLDQISVAPPKLDYSKDRSHPPGGGSWWWREERVLLQRVRDEIRKYNPEAIISSENVNEVYIPEIDLFQSYDYQYDFGYQYPKGHSAPLFAFVYHGYTLQFLTFLPPIGVVTEGSGMYHHGIAEALVRGYIPGVFTALKPSRVWWFTEESKVILNRIVQSRQLFKEFLTYGTMLEPPRFETDLAAFTGHSWPFPEKTIQSPAVALSVFQTDDGRIIVILTNRVSQPKAGLFRHGVGRGNQTILVTETLNKNVTTIRTALMSTPFSTTIPGFSIKTLTIEPLNSVRMINWESHEFRLPVASSSEILRFDFRQSSKSIIIDVNEDNEFGYLHILIPQSLLGGTFMATVDGKNTATSVFQNSTHTSLIVTYMKGKHVITLIGTKVIRLATTMSLSVPTEARLGETILISARVSDARGNPIAGSTVKFLVDEELVGSNTTDVLGNVIVAYKITVNAGTHSIRAVFEGSDIHEGSQVTSRLFVNPLFLIIETNLPRRDLIVFNGRTYKTDESGVLVITIDRLGAYQFTSTPSFETSPGVRKVFIGWADGTVSNTRTIMIDRVTEPLTFSAIYRTQFLLTVRSEFSEASGSGWYDAGSEATFSVKDRRIPINPFVTKVFTGWSGDFIGASQSASIIMDGPKTIVARWSEDLMNVYFTASGLAAIIAILAVVMRRRRFRC
jgi:hypothetical protein